MAACAGPAEGKKVLGRVWVFIVYSASGARQRLREPKWLGPGNLMHILRQRQEPLVSKASKGSA